MIGLVERAFEAIGARERHPDVGARRIDPRALAEGLEGFVDLPGVRIGGAEAHVDIGDLAPDATICSSSLIAASRWPVSSSASAR